MKNRQMVILASFVTFVAGLSMRTFLHDITQMCHFNLLAIDSFTLMVFAFFFLMMAGG